MKTPKPYRPPLFQFTGCGPRFMGIEIHTGRRHRPWWFKALVLPLFKACVPIAERHGKIRRYFLYRYSPRLRLHIIDTRLPPGPHNFERRMIHGMFALLQEHIEENGGIDEYRKWTTGLLNAGPNNPPELISAQFKRQTEALALYQWWKIDYPALKRARRAAAEEAYGDEPLFLTDEDAEGLIRSVTLRGIEKEDRDHLRDMDILIDNQEDEMLQRLILIRGWL